MSKFDKQDHDDVVEYTFEEAGRIDLADAETAIFEDIETGETEVYNGPETTRIYEPDTSVEVPSNTRIYVPADSETRVFDPGSPDERTKVYNPDDETEETEVYDPEPSEGTPVWPEKSSPPTPNFSTPNTGLSTLKRNYDWMFEKSLEAGYDPVESARAAGIMVESFSDAMRLLDGEE